MRLKGCFAAMGVAVEYGMKVATMTAEEALAFGSGQADHDIDMVRVVDPDPEDWPALEALGFVLKPQWVTWISRSEADESTFLLRLSSRERRMIRRARKAAEADRVDVRIQTSLAEDEVDDFLDLYRRQISTMRQGRDYASDERAEILDPMNGYLMVAGYVDDVLVGAAVCLLDARRDTLFIRFTAATPEARRRRLNRVLYLEAFQAARAKGISHVSLGSDPAMYGAMTEPGLFLFKAEHGFRPVPEQYVVDDDVTDEAILVLRMAGLADPSVIVAYDTSRGMPARGVTPMPVAEALNRQVPLRVITMVSAETSSAAAFHVDFATELLLTVGGQK